VEATRGLGIRGARKALSHVVTTIIIASTLVVLVLAAVAVTQQVLNSYWPQNDILTGKQFMVSVGEGINNVAWRPSQSNVIPYTTHVGLLAFREDSINYTITIETNNTGTQTFNVSTGIFLYRLPLQYYTMSEGYFERLPYNVSENDPVALGANVTTNRVFLVRESTGTETGYIVLAVVPRFSLINNTITFVTNGDNRTTIYYRLYIANLTLGTVGATQRSITVQGIGFKVTQYSKVYNVTVKVGFPKDYPWGFYNDFFHFNSTEQVIPVPIAGVVVNGVVVEDVVVEVYVGNVVLSYG